MDMEKLLTKEKADSIFEKIAKGLEEDKIVGSPSMLDYAMIRPALHFSLAAASIRPSSCFATRTAIQPT